MQKKGRKPKWLPNLKATYDKFISDNCKIKQYKSKIVQKILHNTTAAKITKIRVTESVATLIYLYVCI
jgi:hypothetical protein